MPAGSAGMCIQPFVWAALRSLRNVNLCHERLPAKAHRLDEDCHHV